MEPQKAKMKAHEVTKRGFVPSSAFILASLWLHFSSLLAFCGFISFHFSLLRLISFYSFWLTRLIGIGSPSQQKLLCWRTLAQATKSLGFRASPVRTRCQSHAWIAPPTHLKGAGVASYLSGGWCWVLPLDTLSQESGPTSFFSPHSAVRQATTHISTF